MLDATIGELLDRRVPQFGDDTAVADARQTLSYERTHEQGCSLAATLLDRGVTPGDRVAVCMSNCAEYVSVVCGLWRSGYVVVPLNDMLSTDEYVFRVRDAGVSALVVTDTLLEDASTIVDALDEVACTVWIPTAEGPASAGPLADEPSRAGGTDADTNEPSRAGEIDTDTVDISTTASDISSETLDWETVLATDAAAAPPVADDPTDPAIIMYTGGTTGQPKGVVHTHESWLAATYSQLVELDIRPDERLLHVTPLPHATGGIVLSAVLRGAVQHVRPGFDPATLVSLVESEEITWMWMVPTMIYRLLDFDHDADLSSLRTVMYGGAPISPERLEEALDAFGPVFLQVYAQTEAINQVATLSKADHATLTRDDPKLRSCGTPVLMSEVRIVDEEGAPVDPGTVGEIVVSGPNLMDSYWKNPEETADTLVDGWLHTGDMAEMDEQGYLYIRDRKKDMIISGGMNVYSKEVEDALHAADVVEDVAIIGVPHEDWGEAVTAVVVPADPAVTEAEILQFAREHLADYKRPKTVDFVEAIPTTSYDKPDKKELRTRYWEGEERNVH